MARALGMRMTYFGIRPFIFAMKFRHNVPWIPSLRADYKVMLSENKDLAQLLHKKSRYHNLWKWVIQGPVARLLVIAGTYHEARLDPGYISHREITPEQTPISSRLADSAYLPLGLARP